MDPSDIRVGLSACLAGERVRWNGDHKRDSYLVDTVGRFVRFVTVCPEMELGLGAPRATLRLQQEGTAVRLVEPASATDRTEAMDAWAARRVRQLARLDLSGFILKSDSPSCGLERVKVWSRGATPVKRGQGRFAAALAAALPDLPLEEEGRLQDPKRRENFFERVFAYRRLHDLFAARWRLGDLVAFHAREELLLLAHHPESYRELGRLVAHAKGRARAEVAADYRSRFLAALNHPATPRRHVNALQHMTGYVSKQLDAAERRELADAIADFGRSLVPRVVPLTLLHHHLRRFDVACLLQQSYLAPHPKELMLRNHV